ncbi:MAG TPA: DnaJ domain-containing protein, partial [Candidatus Dormibacteraeota bacterium]|nr:DnaJ domain-containing protein [Candidatus Dormibacteraeota bacterium]
MPTATMDVYAVLGADSFASWADLQRHYRARARQLHPDAQSSRPRGERLAPARATALFAELQAAWALVSTPERRRAYDQRRRPPALTPPRRPAAPVPRARPRPRPEPWPTPYPVGVVRQTAPGGLHIVTPDSWEDCSLPAWVERWATGADALLVGDIPAQPALRQVLQHTRFVERIRLATMVCGVEPPPEADDQGHDDGRWKVDQVQTAFQRWVRAFPGRRRELPYATDLLLMARLSLRGYQLSLPHPAGLWGAVEPPPQTRAERAHRREAPLLELEVPAAALLVAVAWARDGAAQAALGQGWPAFLQASELPAAAAAAVDRSLGRPRARTDGLAPVP